MDQSRHDFVCTVADRVVALLRRPRQLRRVGHELPRDRVVAIVGVDQLRHRRRHRHRVARRDLFQGRTLLRSDQPGVDEVGQAMKRSGPVQSASDFVHRPVCASSNGVHKTCSIWVAPVRSITNLSRPSATPLASRHPFERIEEILVDRVALAVNPLFFVHVGDEAPALLARLVQLGEAVGELHTARIDLEPLGDTSGLLGLQPAPAPPRRSDIR